MLAEREVVLVGIGHTNAHVLRMWRMRPWPNTRLTCVSDYPVATYSGMLPGVLAGQYAAEAMQIDLVRLCASAGARLICAEVIGIDRSRQQLLLRDRPSIAYDVLSIGTGSRPAGYADIAHQPEVVAIKPMQTFLDRLDKRLSELARQGKNSICVATVGGGVGGIEVTFCLARRVYEKLGHVRLRQILIDAHPDIGSGLLPATRRRIRRQLQHARIEVRCGARVRAVQAGTIELEDGSTIAADLILWASSAIAPDWIASFHMPTDPRGFLLTKPTLRSLVDERIFAVGDAGTIANSPSPKAGVYAVRQGPVLLENLRRALDGIPLLDYVPQERFLKLINTGDGHCIGEYQGFSFQGGWCWQLKDYIDRRFMEKYQDYGISMHSPGDAHEMKKEMRCAGCGSKIGGAILEKALGELAIPTDERVLLGLNPPDDAAVVRVGQQGSVAITTDFFPAPLDDPYLSGRIAALHAASDAYAIGARPIAALAICTLPYGPARRQQELLQEALQGSLLEFKKMDVSLVGGHTIEGEQFLLGFTIIAEPAVNRSLTKDQLRAGDCLVLTKPLGIGVLLAGHMRAVCRAEWMERLVQTMLVNPRDVMRVAERFDIRAATDVTGFGLAGHLLEMLRASRLGAELELEAIPLLPGVAELLQRGVESTLAPSNRISETEIEINEPARQLPEYAALFDPQTAGGLLLSVPRTEVESVLSALHAELSFPSAAVIGQIEPLRAGKRAIRIRRRQT